MTLPTQLVLLVLLDDPGCERYGLELAESTGLATGTLHPILHRLEQAQWVLSCWEDSDPHSIGRPRRKYYRVNPNAMPAIQREMTRTATQRSVVLRAFHGDRTSVARNPGQ